MNNLFSHQLLMIKKIKLILKTSEQRSSYIFFGLMLIAMTLETLGIGLIAPLVKIILEPDIITTDNYLTGLIRFIEVHNHKSLIVISAVTLIVVFVIKNVFLGYFTWYKVRYIHTLRMNLSNRLFKTYLSQPYTFHMQRNSGTLIQNISTEVTIFTGRLLSPLAAIISEFLILLGIVVLLLIVEPIGALTVIAILGSAGFLISLLTRKHITRWGKERQYHEGKRIQQLQQGLGGIKDVLFLGKNRYFFKQYQNHNSLSTIPDQKQAFLQEIPRFWFEVLAILGVAIMILVMVYQEKELSTVFSVLGIFTAAAFRLMPSVTRILSAVQSLRYSMPVLDTLCEEFNLKKTESIRHEKDSHAVVNSKFKSALLFNHIMYTYPSVNKASLNDVTLSILRGECIGIIGSSGSGKSTIVDIFLGLLVPNSGEVTVDGEDIQMNIRNWQNQIGYVPQSIYLIDDSIRNNIAFGVPEEEIDDLLIENAVQAARLSDFIDSLPDGADTFVGERGVRLSGGQRQRIGIARALYYNPEIIVFDEATSSLDNDTESQIMETIHSLHHDKTIIIVAHRLSTVEKCDRLYRIDHGAIVEEGTPQELLT